MITISVVIPTYAREDFLSKCLEKLSCQIQAVSKDLYEVIVSDDSQDNTTFNLVNTKYPWAKWVKGPGKGPAANRNNGAKYAKGEWLIFIDDDCIPDSNLINAYNEAVIDYAGTKVFEGYINADRVQRHFMEESPLNKSGGFLWSCNFMIEKNFFTDVLKGFDENYRFAAMEDIDLHYRIKKLNEPVKFLEQACVIHPWRIQDKPFQMGEKRFASLLYFINKFPEKQKQYNALYFIRAFKSTGAGIVKNSFRFRFRGVGKRVLITFMQLYFALRVSFGNHKRDNRPA